MRTEEEIIARMAETKSPLADFFGVQRGDLMGFLPYERVKSFLQEGVTEEQWKAGQTPNTPEAIQATMKDYMTFAWEKANSERGLSAARSIDHMKAWLWLLGDDALIERFSLDNFSHYGKPQLRAICEHYGWDWTAWDNGLWSNNEGGPYVRPDQVPLVGLSA